MNMKKMMKSLNLNRKLNFCDISCFRYFFISKTDEEEENPKFLHILAVRRRFQHVHISLGGPFNERSGYY